MIYIGKNNNQKKDIITEYCNKNTINRIVVFSPDRFNFDFSTDIKIEFVNYPDIIRYIYFYRLLQEIDKNTLIVINECLRTKNRNDLTYNCLRHYLNQTDQQIIFQYIPIIESFNDFLTLFDFDTKSRWKREKKVDLSESEISVEKKKIILNSIKINTEQKLFDKYQKEKKKLFDNIGNKDPHTIPRNLLLLAGKTKFENISDDCFYIGRNNRFKLENYQVFKSFINNGKNHVIFEICHNFIDFTNFLFLSEQEDISYMVTELPVDVFYYNRTESWVQELNNVYSEIQ